jgi:methylmalonyl-CoA/ethylmalonyl-CoA epimerase
MAAGDPIDIRYHHVALSVPDLDASVGWYRDVLGFDVERRLHLPTVPAEVALLRRGPMRIELFQPEAGNPLPPDRSDVQDDLRTHGTKHVAYAVRDIGALVAELETRGADIALTRQTAGVSFAYVRDNSGNLIEFYEQQDLWEH